MGTLPDIDESGVYVFETTVDAPDTQEPESSVEAVSADIDTQKVPRDQVLEAFVSSTELAYGDNLDGRIAYIAKQIEQLKSETRDARVESLDRSLYDLFRSTDPEPGPAAVPPAQTLKTEVKRSFTPAQAERLTRIESRLSALEKKVGGSPASAPLMDIVASIRQSLRFLESRPEEVDEAVQLMRSAADAAVGSPGVDVVTRMYSKVAELEPLLKSLPHVIARLRTLQALHFDASVSQGVVNDISATLETVRSDIEKWNQTLQRLEPKVCDAIASSKGDRS